MEARSKLSSNSPSAPMCSILVLEIPLATANDTVGASRDPQGSDNLLLYHPPILLASSLSTSVSILTGDGDKSKLLSWIDAKRII